MLFPLYPCPLAKSIPLILTALLGRIPSTAALVVGADVSSSFNSDDVVQCLRFNTGLISTTTAAFTSTYSNALLTWTEAIRYNPDPRSTSATLDRDIYFGYSPSNASGSSESTSFRACSLVFYDAYVLPNVTSDDSQTTIDWSQELPSDCVASLTSYVDGAAQRTTIDSDQDISDFCQQQGHNLFRYHPAPCTGYQAGTVGVKAFTTNSSQPGNCTLRTGENYNLRLIQTLDVSTIQQTLGLKELVQGTMPMITVLFPTPGSNGSGPETHYAALRPERNLLPLVDGSVASRINPTSFVFLSWVVGVFFSVVEFSSL